MGEDDAAEPPSLVTAGVLSTYPVTLPPTLQEERALTCHAIAAFACVVRDLLQKMDLHAAVADPAAPSDAPSDALPCSGVALVLLGRKRVLDSLLAWSECEMEKYVE